MLWIVYYLDGTTASNDTFTWGQVSERIPWSDTTVDSLIRPAAELCVQYAPLGFCHRLRSPTQEGERFFFYRHIRYRLMGDPPQVSLLAIGYILPNQHRLIMEIGPNWSTTRLEAPYV